MKVSIKVKIEATANDWQLYHIVGVSSVAKALSVGASAAINLALKMYNSGLTYDDAYNAAYKHWCDTAEKYSEFGAIDTEPREYFLWMLKKYLIK